MLTIDEILNALQTIKDLCLSYKDCTGDCPLYVDYRCGLDILPSPDKWQLNDSIRNWKAFKE